MISNTHGGSASVHRLATLSLGIVVASLLFSFALLPQKAHAAITITAGTIHIQSNNASSTLATSTNQAAVYFTTSSPITIDTRASSLSTSTVRILGTTIASTTISLVPGTTKTYVASTTLSSVTPADGNLTFLIYFADNTGNSTTTATQSSITDNSQVRYDTGVPTITPSTITSSNSNTALAKSGNTVTLNFTSSEAIQAPTVQIGAHTGITAVTSNGGGAWQTGSTTWTATANIDATDSDGTLTFSITTPQDLAGNATTSASWLSSTGVRVDETAPTITVTGTNPLTVNPQSTYNDAGATASDSYDGTITSSIVTVNPVNTAVAGQYTVTYNVSDAAGNAATQQARTVTVNPGGGGLAVGSGPLAVGYVNSGGGGGATYQPATVPASPMVGAAAGTNTTASTGSHKFAALMLALKRGVKSGNAVQVLQEMLNQDPETHVAATGPGSPGNETTSFGALTEAAVQKFQAKYGIVSSGTAATTGYGAVGPKTRAKLNALYGQ